MNVLILGGGGREHALAWKINQSPMVSKLFCIPGNAGIEEEAECVNLSLKDFQKIETFINEKSIEFTVVGPEQPLVDGIVDFLTNRGCRVFGPNRDAAQMEGSKSFAKILMKKYEIPTADFEVFTDYDKALSFVDTLPESKIVVKADGLAAGKGSVVCQDRQEAREIIKQMIIDRMFAEAGAKLVVEEYMEGEEASFFVITDGKSYKTLSPAQDYKRAFDGDEGKNTGGMGSYAPAPVVTESIAKTAIDEIVEPVLTALNSEGIDYKGVLYCGLMLTETGPRVVEFNARFGDPETQVVLPLLETDLMEVLVAAQDGNLDQVSINHKPEYAVCVIAASGGYPDAYEKGKLITGIDQLDSDVNVFHAGTRREEGKLLTNGGRVLGITATDSELKSAANKVYDNMSRIEFEGIHYRKDISRRAWK